MRKTLFVLGAAALAAAGAARAAGSAEPIPPEFFQQFAPLAIQLLQAQFPNPPVKIDPQPEKIVGSHVEMKIGVVALPDKNLTPKAVEEAGDKDVPVAVVVTRAVTLQEGEGTVSKDKLAIIEFGDAARLPIFFLAVRGNAAERTLLVYGKEGKPLATVPLKKQAGDLNVPLALKLTDIDLEKKTMNATFDLSGTWEGTLKMAYAEF